MAGRLTIAVEFAVLRDVYMDLVECYAGRPWQRARATSPTTTAAPVAITHEHIVAVLQIVREQRGNLSQRCNARPHFSYDEVAGEVLSHLPSGAGIKKSTVLAKVTSFCTKLNIARPRNQQCKEVARLKRRLAVSESTVARRGEEICRLSNKLKVLDAEVAAQRTELELRRVADVSLRTTAKNRLPPAFEAPGPATLALRKARLPRDNSPEPRRH